MQRLAREGLALADRDHGGTVIRRQPRAPDFQEQLLGRTINRNRFGEQLSIMDEPIPSQFDVIKWKLVWNENFEFLWNFWNEILAPRNDCFQWLLLFTLVLVISHNMKVEYENFVKILHHCGPLGGCPTAESGMQVVIVNANLQKIPSLSQMFGLKMAYLGPTFLGRGIYNFFGLQKNSKNFNFRRLL